MTVANRLERATDFRNIGHPPVQDRPPRRSPFVATIHTGEFLQLKRRGGGPRHPGNPVACPEPNVPLTSRNVLTCRWKSDTARGSFDPSTSPPRAGTHIARLHAFHLPAVRPPTFVFYAPLTLFVSRVDSSTLLTRLSPESTRKSRFLPQTSFTVERRYTPNRSIRIRSRPSLAGTSPHYTRGDIEIRPPGFPSIDADRFSNWWRSCRNSTIGPSIGVASGLRSVLSSNSRSVPPPPTRYDC